MQKYIDDILFWVVVALLPMQKYIDDILLWDPFSATTNVLISCAAGPSIPPLGPAQSPFLLLRLIVFIGRFLPRLLTLFHPGGADLPPPRANAHTCKKSMGGNSDKFCIFLNVC